MIEKFTKAYLVSNGGADTFEKNLNKALEELSNGK